ncbi:hypothetical protein DCC85_02135 [Paenibacillus sp. CAA11]|uniref:hypothetical protein n=1 Tax=Paenibacillus sp. CAA11 TaxID=1532905 RepID=UPI000D36F957|nr:hypothetical protein [Paenibacillus sp. CAA11]AWB43149.1 hypothetical protein DCC85_02135 [Paenibacillus sp. CAA11]
MGNIQEGQTGFFRKMGLIILGSVLAAALAGCKDQNDKPAASPATPSSNVTASQSSKDVSEQAQEKGDSAMNPVTANESPSDTQEHSQHPAVKGVSYLGEWEISKDLPSNISALSDEEITDYIGTKLVYHEDRSDFNGEQLRNPVYSIQSQTRDEFEEGYKVNLDDWSLKGDSIQEIQVYKDQGKTQEWDEYAGTTYLIDGKLVISIEGQFFELKKVDPDSQPPTVKADRIKAGSKLSGLTVKEVTKNEDGTVSQITFSDHITVEGSYELAETEEGLAYQLTPDTAYKKMLPVLDEAMASDPIIVLISGDSQHKEEKGHAKLTISNYSIALAQISRSAELVKLIKD